ncbi:hypothetical protein [Ruminococcus champanellensis]
MADRCGCAGGWGIPVEGWFHAAVRRSEGI